MNNRLVTGIILGVGVGIGILAVEEAKKAYDKFMLKQKIKGLWSDINKVWNKDTKEMD